MATIGRGEKLPSATAFVPSASSNSGRARSVAIRKALTMAPKIASNSVSDSVMMYILRKPERPSERSWYSL